MPHHLLAALTQEAKERRRQPINLVDASNCAYVTVLEALAQNTNDEESLLHDRSRTVFGGNTCGARNSGLRNEAASVTLSSVASSANWT